MKWLKTLRNNCPAVEGGRNQWHKIDSAAINQPMRSGEHIYFEFSPYDIPEAVSGQLDKEHGTARVLFRYLNDEPTNRIDMEGFVVYLGKRSHRLHKMEVPTSTLPRENIMSAISQAIDRLKLYRPTELPPDKYEIAKEIVSDAGDKLLEQVA